MPSAVKTKPKLWKSIVASVKAGSKGGDPGQWSAVKANLATQRYQKARGGYSSRGPSKAQTSQAKWNREKWRTSDGKPAIRRNRKGEKITKRFLPSAAWNRLTSGQKAATNRKKVLGSKRGKQFISNTRKAMQAGKEARS